MNSTRVQIIKRRTALFVVVAMFAAITHADETYTQVMVQAEFIAVQKTVLDNIDHTAADRLSFIEQIIAFKESGQATVLQSPTVLTHAGQESTIKAVKEIRYPTDLSVTIKSVTNAWDQVSLVSVIKPSKFQTREIGAIFTALPDYPDRNASDIWLTFQAEFIAPPVWKKYSFQYTDLSGNAKTAQLEQPFFHSRKVSTTTVRIKNGTTILASGGMSDQENEKVMFILIKAQLLDSEGKPVGASIGVPGKDQR